MREIIYLVLTLVFLISCNKKPMSRKEMLLGHWKVVQKSNSIMPLLHMDLRGYEFRENNICDNMIGYYNRKEYKADHLPYYSSYSKYILLSDSIKVYNNAYKRWDSFKIEKFNEDTLALSGHWNSKKEYLEFTKQYYTNNYTHDFDALISSRSPCFGPCPVNDIYISETGNIEILDPFDSLHAWSTSKINQDEFNRIKNKFKIAGIDTLNNIYYDHVTDASSVSVSFIKNRRIIKTVFDYANSAPTEFIWAYYDLNYMFKKLPLNEKVIPQEYVFFTLSFIDNKNQQLELTGSEKYFLVQAILKAKVVNVSFNEIYSLQTYKNKTTTDGRYYKFYNPDGTTKTIDIGYNFLKENKLAHNFQKI